MRKSLKNAVLASLIGVTVASALPPEALAGPTAIAPASVVGLDNQTTAVHWRRWGYVRHGYWRPHRWGYARYGYWRPHRWGYYGYRRYYGYYRPYYYRRVYYPYYGYRYDPGGAIFASAALGLMGAGIAAATAPRWGWGYGGWGGGWGGWGPGWGGWW